MPVSNEDIAEILESMGTPSEMKGDTVFKIRAYTCIPAFPLVTP